MSIVRPIITNIITSIIRSVTGEQLPTWTLGYNGTDTFGLLDATFTPTGAGTVYTVKGVYESDGSNAQLTGGVNNAVNWIAIIGVDDTINWDSDVLTSVTINGLPATKAVTVVEDGYFELTGILDATADIKYIGSADSTNFYQTQLHLVSAIDPLDSANSIERDNRIQSAIQPTDFNIYNALTGLVIGTYSNGTYELLEDGS